MTKKSKNLEYTLEMADVKMLADLMDHFLGNPKKPSGRKPQEWADVVTRVAKFRIIVAADIKADEG